MFSPDQWAASTGVAFFNNVATQSLRFDSGSSPFLSFDPASSTAGTWTLSVWVKRANLGASSVIFSSGVIDARGHVFFTSTDELQVQPFNSSGQAGYTITNMKFRDTSAWYHIVVSANGITTSNIATNLTIYVNGVVATRTTNVGSSATGGDRLNDAQAKRIGELAPDSGSHFDGYMCDFNWVDGTALDQNNFGEFKNGTWIAIEPNVSNYGSAGFRLQFNQTGTGTGSTTTVGADTSGNLNHWDSSGIDTEDCAMPDCPENNFPTINTLHMGSSYSATTTSEGNLSFKHSNFAHASAIASMTLPKSGKWYWETLNNSSATNGTNTVGCVVSTYNNSNALSGAGAYFWASGFGIYGNTGANFGSTPSVTWDTTGSATTFTADDIIGVAYDADNKNVEWYKNGVKIDYNVTDFDDDGNDLIPASSAYGNPANAGIIFNFGQDPSFAGSLTGVNIGTETPSEGAGVFKHAVPSGYKALCSANISDDDLPISPAQSTQADDHFTPIVYVGNTTDGHLVPASGDTPDSISFAPDLIWIKNRDVSHAHILVDSVRGVNAGYLTSINFNTESGNNSLVKTIETSSPFGFTLGTAGAVNGANDLVAWVWKAGGTASTIAVDTYLAGVPSIASSVSANTDAGFSIVTYTGDGGSSATIGHGLDAVPKMLIVKNRDAQYNWKVYHESIGNTKYLTLDTTDLANTATSHWNNTTPDKNVFTIGSSNALIRLNDNFVAYCFAEIEGFSKFGSFTGGGSNFPFVYTGFRPAFVMFKNVSTTAAWIMQDTTRDPQNVANLALVANDTFTEATVAARPLDFVSNGFKLRTSATDTNGSGNTITYMAFAENPFKYANAR